MQRLYKECSAKPVSAFDLYKKSFIHFDNDNQIYDSNQNSSKDNHPMTTRYLSTAMSTLDFNLNGGIRIGSVTEISGRAGVGKSQLAMQLCIVASKFNQGSIYIDTEQKMSLPRMYEMAHERFLSSTLNGRNNSDSVKKTNDYKSSDIVLQNVIVHKPQSTNEMVSIISKLEEEILIHNEEALENEQSCHNTTVTNESNSTVTKYPIRFLMIDSIAAPTRRDFGSESANERVSAILQISQTLKRMADQLQIAVVVINQVGLVNMDDRMNDNFSKPITNTFELTKNDGSDFVKVAASLGVSWHHCVSTRILLEHERDPHRQASEIDLAQEAAMTGESHHKGFNHSSSQRQIWMMERGLVRTASVVKSNVVGYSTMYFHITKIGVCELDFGTN